MIDKRNKEIAPLLQKVRVFAGRFFMDKNDRDDLVQTVMLKLLVAKGELKDISFGYAYAVTRNAAIDLYRSRRSDEIVRFVDFVELENTSSFLAPRVNPVVSDPFLRNQLDDALASLSNEHREALLLNVEGLSDQQIADVLQIPIGTVKSRIYYGRRYLSEKLCA